MALIGVLTALLTEVFKRALSGAQASGLTRPGVAERAGLALGLAMAPGAAELCWERPAVAGWLLPGAFSLGQAQAWPFVLGPHRLRYAIDPLAALPPWPLSRPLLQAVLDDRLSDRFVCELIWWRLGYRPMAASGAEAIAPGSAESESESWPGAGAGAGASQAGPGQSAWLATAATPAAWAERFPMAPELVAERPANVQLTRSIPAPLKQLLKQQLGFGGYRIGELYPRRTRRAVAVSWLLAHLVEGDEALAESGPLPPLLAAPLDPVIGHPGDRPVA